MTNTARIRKSGTCSSRPARISRSSNGSMAAVFRVRRRPRPPSSRSISAFCDLLPEDLRWVENPETQRRLRVIPGEMRKRDVRVGRHVPVSPGALPRFVARFEELGRVDTMIAAATAHHRLLWMHPFLDVNGRVARLMTYAIICDALDTAVSGRSRGALPAMKRLTKPTSWPATSRAATILTGAAA